MIHSPSPALRDFKRFCIAAGENYILSGGTASRVEEQLSQLGAAFGIQTQIYATPSGFFMSATDEDHLETTTLFIRVRDSAISLCRLKTIENLIDDIQAGHRSLNEATQEISKIQITSPYQALLTRLGVILVGFSASLPVHNEFKSAFLSALIALLVFESGSVVNKVSNLSAIFNDFIRSTVAFILSGVFGLLAGVPAEGCVIGALVIIAPGLTWVTAVTEVADHDLISGTSKMMRGLLTLLAMGTSYSICHEATSHYLPSLAIQSVSLTPPSFLTQALSSALLVGGFSVLLDIPKRDYLVACILGLLSWWIAHALSTPTSMMISVFAASFFVGFASTFASRTLKSPVQVYAVPGILTLLPGMVGFVSFQSMVRGEYGLGLELGFRVSLLAGSIVFGLLSARLVCGSQDKIESPDIPKKLNSPQSTQRSFEFLSAKPNSR